MCCGCECMLSIVLWFERRGAILVFLVAGLSLGLTADFRFPGGALSRVVSLSVTVMWGGLGRCRLWMCVLCGWRFLSMFVSLVCYGCWSVRLAEGESCITVISRVDGWELEISRADCLGLCR